MRRLMLCAVASALLVTRPLSGADTLYNVREGSGQALGAYDVNIMADDVHIRRPATLNNIQVILAIAGRQTNALWLFGGTNQDALQVIPFTNRPAADEQDWSLYSFDISAEVPKDFYVGFSAQGDGWGSNKSDLIYGGTNLDVGIVSNYNTFFYGPVVKGRLFVSYTPPAEVGFFYMTISGKYLAPAIGGVSFSSNMVSLSVTNLIVGETNAIEHIGALSSNLWVSVGSFVAAAGHTNWSQAAAGNANRGFYRIHVTGP